MITFPIDPSRVRVDELSEEMQELVEPIGLDSALKLMEHFGGAELYITSLTPIRHEQLVERLQEEYDGTNAGSLARRYGISRRQVLKVVKD